jgi:hypothetical protein
MLEHATGRGDSLTLTARVNGPVRFAEVPRVGAVSEPDARADPSPQGRRWARRPTPYSTIPPAPGLRPHRLGSGSRRKGPVPHHAVEGVQATPNVSPALIASSSVVPAWRMKSRAWQAQLCQRPLTLPQADRRPGCLPAARCRTWKRMKLPNTGDRRRAVGRGGSPAGGG